MTTIGATLDRIELLVATDQRQDVTTRRKKATVMLFLSTVIASDVEWRDRVAKVQPHEHPVDTALALATAFSGKRLPLVDTPLPKQERFTL